MGQGRGGIKGAYATVTFPDPNVIYANRAIWSITNPMLRYAIAALVCLATPALAEIPKNLARADVVSGWRQGATHVAGLTIRMAPGWHTYWRAPGDSGIPPSFNWSGSSNIAHVAVRFPVPEVLDQYGMRSIGYTDEVTFPLLIRTRDAKAPIRLRGEISIGVCYEICVPVTLDVSAELSASGKRDRALARLLKDQPKDGGTLSCDISPMEDGLRMTASTTLPRMQGEEVAVIETGDAEVWVSKPELTRQGGRLVAEVEMVPPSAKPFALARSSVRMTVIARGRAVEMVGCR